MPCRSGSPQGVVCADAPIGNATKASDRTSARIGTSSVECSRSTCLDSVASAFRRKGTFWHDRPVAALHERRDLLPIDRLVHPHAHPQATTVWRGEAADVLQRRGGVCLVEPERDRRPSL